MYTVTYTHPDEVGWKEHVRAHTDYLLELLRAGSLVASGPNPDADVRSAMLILRAANRRALDEIIAADPFDRQDLIADMTVREWDPIFGVFNEESSAPDHAFRTPAAPL